MDSGTFGGNLKAGFFLAIGALKMAYTFNFLGQPKSPAMLAARIIAVQIVAARYVEVSAA